jgi:hypothetical protein
MQQHLEQPEPSRVSKREKKKLVYLPDGVVVDEYKWTKMLDGKKAKIFEFKPTELAGRNQGNLDFIAYRKAASWQR